MICLCSASLIQHDVKGSHASAGSSRLPQKLYQGRFLPWLEKRRALMHQMVRANDAWTCSSRVHYTTYEVARLLLLARTTLHTNDHLMILFPYFDAPVGNKETPPRIELS